MMQATAVTSGLHVRLCLGSSCFSRGNGRALQLLQQYLKENGLEERVFLSGALCDGHCSGGPMLRIGETDYEKVEPATILDLLRHHLEQSPTSDGGES